MDGEQQADSDYNMRAFIEKYSDDVELATIAFMPLSTLTIREFDRITELLEYRLGDDLWERFS